MRKDFDTREGWRVEIIAASGKPLWPQGFDPLNVERVDGGLLHTRFLKLGNEACTMTAIDEEGVNIDALTEAVGPHPLFNGVRRVVIAGLAEPHVTHDTSRVSIAMSGLRVECAGASIERAPRRISLTLKQT
jgi:uncharacterized Zn-finger protein